MDYTTQMDAARKGIVTPQMKIVAEKEHMPVEKLMALVASGKVAIPANKVHTSLSPPAQMPGPGGHRLHAPHQDQRQPRRFSGTQQP